MAKPKMLLRGIFINAILIKYEVMINWFGSIKDEHNVWKVVNSQAHTIHLFSLY